MQKSVGGGDVMVGVWMTPCKNGQCELSVRRDGINKIVIATKTPLTDAQAEELFWCVGAMQRSEKTLKDLRKEQEAVEPKQVGLYGKEDWYGLVCVCPDCKAEWMSDEADTHFCPKCGRAVKWE